MLPLSCNRVEPPVLSNHRLRVRREHLVDEIRRLEASSLLRRRSLRPVWTRQRAFAVAALLLILVGASTALAVTRFDVFSGPAAPAPEGPRIVVASGQDWSVLAWPSVDGVCLAIELPHLQGASGCGFPVAGATKGASARGKSKVIAGLILSGVDLPSGFSVGLASGEVTRVDTMLLDATSSPTTIYRAPSELRTRAKIFFTRFDVKNPPVSFSAFSQDGQVLGRWMVAGPARRVVRVHG